MPVIMASKTVSYTDIGYYVDLNGLHDKFPHLSRDRGLEIYLVELRDEQNKLIKRLKPFERLQLKTDQYWNKGLNKNVLCLLLPENMVSKFNIGKNYKITFIIIKYDGKPFLPLENRIIGYNTFRVSEYFSKIEANLLLLSLEQPILNKASSYLWDAWLRLEEGDIEGARTAIRNSLDVLKQKFLPQLILLEGAEESSEFPSKLRNLATAISNFLHYGGPHPGPAPKSTTELTLSLTIDLIRYLAIALRQGLIVFQENEK
ncbi:hypothetical protein [Candidatus Borrarchaeum sp.]|uniref:hypothetical protein n=1 Tax=Candidatus Borrarchaeum sp. TaxID=2846742 RepID=UPI002580D5A3|nr:hypothetical protein [Candidatus Borrarchaeum sp.]